MDPTASAQTLFLQSTQQLAAGDTRAAEASLRRALTLDPLLAEAHANLAWLLDAQQQSEAALQHYQRAVFLQPDNVQIRVNLAALLTELGAQEPAVAHCLHALALQADNPAAWTNLGALQALAGQDAEAETSLRQALQLDPNRAKAHFNLASLLLRKGRFAEGWEHLEWRPGVAARGAQIASAAWQGEPLQGRSILVGFDAGHGDLIQFCRYLPQLKAAGAGRVGLLCHPALARLMQTLAGLDAVLPFDQAWARDGWDCWTAAMSLPRLFGTRLETIPAPIPYLGVPPDARRQWAQTLAQRGLGPGLRVGLVWQGNPQFQNDARRSLATLELLAPLWQVAGLQFVSLQKGPGAQQARQCALPLLNLDEALHDFADTAAVLQQLDLLISVDTAVAHLAGALGTACWVLLPAYMTDWRWLEQRSDSPWYPQGMRLVRQQAGESWDAVLQRLLPELVAWAAWAGEKRQG